MSSGLAAALLEELDDDALDALADRLFPRLAARLERDSNASPLLNTKGAAAYLSCSPGRVHDLVQLRKLKPERDGRRLLFRREELERYLRADQ
jgi:excisionase family DNA binding protein